jgi:hypothetical protein
VSNPTLDKEATNVSGAILNNPIPQMNIHDDWGEGACSLIYWLPRREVHVWVELELQPGRLTSFQIKDLFVVLVISCA